MKKYSILFILLFLIPSLVLANPGLKIDNDKIIIKEPLQAGEIYKSSSVLISNNGGQEAHYHLTVNHDDVQQEIKLEEEWLNFSANNFDLKPNQEKEVVIFLNLPIRIKAGNYFTLIDVYPIDMKGDVYLDKSESIRFYFSVTEVNLFQGIYYKVITFFTEYSPASYIIAIISLIMISLWILSKKFRLKIRLAIKNKKIFFGKF
jgi:hypothetical protein